MKMTTDWLELQVQIYSGRQLYLNGAFLSNQFLSNLIHCLFRAMQGDSPVAVEFQSRSSIVVG